MSPTIVLAFTENKHTKSGWAGFSEYAKYGLTDPQFGVLSYSGDQCAWLMARSYRIQGYDVHILNLDESSHDASADIVIHKLTNILDRAEDGDPKAVEQVQKFESFVANTPVLDPLPAVRRLLKRERTMVLLQDIIQKTRKENVTLFHIAPFAVLSRAELLSQKYVNLVKFPAVIKHVTAASSQAAHQMAIVPSSQQLNTALTELAGPPESPSADKWFLQEWVNHDGVIFKVFVVGDHVHTVVRPSLQNITSGHGIFHFDSQKIPKSFAEDSASHSNSNLPTFATRLSSDARKAKELELDTGRAHEIARVLAKELQLTLFGFDLIVESGTGQHFVIDINYCPGYDGVPNFHAKVLHVIQQKIQKDSKSARRV
ncbi:uncharacterized protein SPPG_00404 [Spizellomyces punctatus DAOM BR117]|uniref:inositol-1,3,4-trisphosphate 5/6-kinase n=1 Tax=Spizellomyces punctatus (strain DAOM BR117) TaxID=645134 RepID=A0A0L0HUB3_SPIPD|nr:uncharacterized protein SPPG_00404 [Spizellomyces punctatus DAOM BR117]KND04693.1 hypothetical protein SPPG_00404 [Spizellomyces punctatus DAOM BR117]|eukprot:XP_016612732.1 hypothetical protein SPPG_00404 [Spizellomyces punctatus DAOM BR117]